MSAEAAKKKVLVIDDEKVIRDLAEEIIGMFGYVCETAVDGNDGLKKVEEFQPDLVICDLYMPGISGIQVLETVKRNNPQTIVLLSTGMELDDDEQTKLDNLGAAGLIRKPFTINWFQEKLQKLLQ